MKKLLLILALTLVAITGNAQSSPRGDMDNDGVVSVSDVMELVGIILNGDAAQSYFTCPDNHHPHLIDLGLPSGTKWACCNVDTDHPENQSPTNYGSYYAWGETETKTTYSQDTYSHYQNGSYVDLGSDIAGTQYDVAHAKWGGSWVMPSNVQISELINNCTYEWTTVNGVNGGKFTGTNGGSIFLPAAGYRYDSDLYYAGTYGFFWSSTQYPSFALTANSLYFLSDGAYAGNYDDRGNGLTVRPVVRMALSSTSLNLIVGEEGTISVTSGSGSYSAESSDSEVATAVVDGTSVKVTAVGAGTATITVTDRRSSETASIEVTVTASLCPDGNHPHLIDLGLPSGTKWACCNVDTDHPENQSPTNYGSLFAWGETETKTTYSWSSYIYCNGTMATCYDIGDCISGTEYDVAQVKWGASWQMPTFNQNLELYENCLYIWTTLNGVKGVKFTSKNNGMSIFMPVAGDLFSWNQDISNFYDGFHGGYWSGTPMSGTVHAYCLYFNSIIDDIYTDDARYLGHCVRPIVESQQ